MMSSFERHIGASALSLETGRLAQQANGSVLVRYGDTVVLVTATMSKPREGIDFFPLTIDFEERLYARGKIPHNWFRREGRPQADAILTDRLTDRSLRPLFPKGFRNEVQIIATPLSADLENPLDIPTMIGASAALGISDIPFSGPVGATRMGYVEGEFIVNPTYQQLEQSELDLVVAGTRAGVMMIEAGAHRLSEDTVLEAIRQAQDVNLDVVDLQEEANRAVGKDKLEFQAGTYPAELDARIGAIIDGRMALALDANGGKADQEGRLDALRTEVMDGLQESFEAGHVKEAYQSLVEKEFRRRILENGLRPDGRGLTEIRQLTSDVGLLPRTHGSGLFTRGQTQILGITTLGSVGDAQRLDNLSPQESKRFLLHYNFPPYSTGEAKRLMSAGRREVGHGALAERAIAAVLPDEEEFPYTIRVVAEALSSNGSTSMGSVCAATLALMDAGVPIQSPVAGISIGLVTGENGKFATLTDIQGMEDHFGDMDFKVAGTADGITAIQLDIKVTSIGFDVIEAALAQARDARLTLLKHMSEAIDLPRQDLSPYAPRMTRITIPVDKIGVVIGPGGKTIRGIVDETGATVDVQDDGSIMIGSADGAASERAVEIIEGLTKEVKVGEIYTGKVVRILAFGAFVELLPGTDGMVHISELANHHVPAVEDEVQLGEEITVVVKGVDPSGKVSLSRRALLEEGEPGSQQAGETASSGARPPDRRPRGGPEGGNRQGNGRPTGGGRPGQRSQGGGWRGPERGGPGSSGPRTPR